MKTNQPIEISNFFVAGINYKKTDASTRGQFAINDSQYQNIIRLAPEFQLDSFFVLSTCNRTEIYGFAESAEQLANILCTQTTGSKEIFDSLSYNKRSVDAVQHLFKVAAGLDSQILGDYEITGQLKQAVKFSKDRGFINCFTERLFSCVMQASKIIKNDTALSAGTVSVSFAAVQFIKDNVTIDADTKILLIGTGKIGRTTCKNLVDYIGTTNITLINRSDDKAIELAAELNLEYAPLSALSEQIGLADIILTATNASEPTVLRSQVENKGNKLILDLSVPANVEPSVHHLSNITLINVDELSRLKDETLLKREAETPKAMEIIAEHMGSFIEWYAMRRNAPALNAIKARLNEIYLQQQLLLPDAGAVYPLITTEQQIQRVVNGAAYKMRSQNHRGCHHIEAINEFMNLAV